MEKISIAIVSETKDHSRCASHLCVLTVTFRYPRLDQFGSLDFHFWIDGCSVQYQSRFVFQQTTLFISLLNVTSYYNERHHGNGFIKGGCIKNSVYRSMMAEKNFYTHTISFR